MWIRKGTIMGLTKNFIIDINNFSELSREVGYYNHKANVKTYDENNNDVYDIKSQKKYEKLRGKQLDMLNELIKQYGMV